jgi:hypothetical protein
MIELFVTVFRAQLRDAFDFDVRQELLDDHRSFFDM